MYIFRFFIYFLLKNKSPLSFYLLDTLSPIVFLARLQGLGLLGAFLRVVLAGGVHGEVYGFLQHRRGLGGLLRGGLGGRGQHLARVGPPAVLAGLVLGARGQRGAAARVAQAVAVLVQAQEAALLQLVLRHLVDTHTHTALTSTVNTQH